MSAATLMEPVRFTIETVQEPTKIAVKQCEVCEATKPITLFPTDDREPDGKAVVCGLCCCTGRELPEEDDERDEQRREQARTYQRAYTERLRQERLAAQLPRRGTATECLRGHPRTETNTGYQAHGGMYCKDCRSMKRTENAALRTAAWHAQVDARPPHRVLRRELSDAREFGLGFTSAWQGAVLTALVDVEPQDVQGVKISLGQARKRWQVAYEDGTAIPRCDD